MKINFKAIPEAFKVLGKVMQNNKSTILVGAGIVGWIGTAVLVGNAAPKAKTAIDKEKKELYENYEGEDLSEVKLKPVDVVKATWQYYIPAAVTGIASSAAIIYAHKIDLSKIVSITTSYQLAKGELKNLKDKIIEKDGDKKLKEYEKDVHADVLEAVPSTEIFNTGKGTTIFYDPTSATLFYSDIWHVTRALEHMIDGCRDEGTYNLSELRDDIGLPRVSLLSDFAFYYESVREITKDNISDLFEYHSVDADNGDLRPCIWLDIEDRVYNVCDQGLGSSFRRKY